MKMYFKGYAQRVTMIILTVVTVLMAQLLSYGLFQEKLHNVSGQLNSYGSADYSIIYMLNYGNALAEECLYPDTDIQFFLDTEKTHRLTVSCVMKEEGVSYGLDYLRPLSALNTNEMCISQNVAAMYRISVGDTVFAESLYTTSLIPIKVTAVMGVDFDYEYPAINNAIGVVFLGYDKQYATSTNGKYMLFANQSQAETLTKYPQIINTIINKNTNENIVLYQGASAVAFITIFTIVALILGQIIFFANSTTMLYRCYLKGMKRSSIVIIPYVERIVFCLLPCAASQCWVTSSMPESIIVITYRLLPMYICILFCIITLVAEGSKLRKKGGVMTWNS